MKPFFTGILRRCHEKFEMRMRLNDEKGTMTLHGWIIFFFRIIFSILVRTHDEVNMIQDTGIPEKTQNNAGENHLFYESTVKLSSTSKNPFERFFG